MKFLRSIHRYFRDARRSVIRNFSLSLASISCIAITLIVVALSIILSYNVKNMTNHVSSNISIIIFLDSKTNEENLDRIKTQLKNLDNVNEIKFKSKKEYAEDTKKFDERFSPIVDSWQEDKIPLLDSYEVTVKDIDNIKDTAEKIKKIENVSIVNYGEEYIETVRTIFSAIEKCCIGGVIALILVTAFLITNTIKLAIFSRKTEIEIMRLVGASNIAIKVPFLIEGSFIGILGAVIPIILVTVGYTKLYDYMGGEFLSKSLGNLVTPYPFIIYVSISLLLIGLLVGMFGSKRAAKKYLKI